jgi:cysteine synthase A
MNEITKLQNTFYPTPLLEIQTVYKGKKYIIYGKYEAVGFSGSIKGRMILHSIKKAYEDGTLKKGDTIIEVTSGNTGIAIATIGAQLGHPVEIIMPDWLSPERYTTMEILGAKITKISRSNGGFLKSLEIAKERASKGGFYFMQFENKYNIDAHYQTTAPEIFSVLKQKNKALPLAFIAGMGSGGTIMGIKQYCMANKIECSCNPLEPASSPILTGEGGKPHKIQGINDNFIPKIFDISFVDEPVSVEDKHAIFVAQEINKKGFSVGISSGANLFGTIKVLEKNQKEIGATILCDSSLLYLSTDLTKTTDQISNFEIISINPL